MLVWNKLACYHFCLDVHICQCENRVCVDRSHKRGQSRMVCCLKGPSQHQSCLLPRSENSLLHIFYASGLRSFRNLFCLWKPTNSAVLVSLSRDFREDWHFWIIEKFMSEICCPVGFPAGALICLTNNGMGPPNCTTVCCMFFLSSCCIFLVNFHKNFALYTVWYCIRSRMHMYAIW